MTAPKDMMKEWGIASLTASGQTDALSGIGRILYQAVLVKSLDILSEKEEKELDTLLDNDATTPEDVMFFLQSKIPTFSLLVKEERAKLKEDLALA